MDKKLYDRLMKFRDDRDWSQFHTGENLAKSICIEAAELLEVYQWDHTEKSIDKVKEELADVFLYATLMADHYHLNIEEIMLEKLKKNEEKYPAELVKGSSKKYNEYKIKARQK
ncbi:MAG: nucleotide pyrophosphohydrolase [Bacilli bacterium]|nr:nucleotide pyrophosphohydrolase [Bacilli bacterium]